MDYKNKGVLNIAIDGNIGTGKSTLLKNLQYGFMNKIPEPVERFSFYPKRNEDHLAYGDFNPLMEQYKNPKADSPLAQLHIINASLKYYNTSLSKSPMQVNVSERCVLSPRVFIEAKRQTGVFSDFSAHYLRDYHYISLSKLPSGVIPQLVIFLDCDPKVCQLRISKRQDDETTDHISLELLEALREVYKKFYSTTTHNDIQEIFYLDTTELNEDQTRSEVEALLNNFMLKWPDLVKNYLTDNAKLRGVKVYPMRHYHEGNNGCCE